jgi:type II protein arginine methyltransferase
LEKFNSLITKLSSDCLKREFIDEEISQNQECFSRCTLSFHANTFYNEVIPLIEINHMLDSTNEEVRENYEKKLICDIEFAYHLRPNGPVYIKPSCNATTLGNFLLKTLPATAYEPSYVVEIDLVSKEYIRRMHFKKENDDDDDDDIPDSWDYWNQIHAATNYNPKIEVALVLSSDIPYDNANIIARWLGESVMMIVVPHTSFLTNSNNYPTFSGQHQKRNLFYLSKKHEQSKNHHKILFPNNSILILSF